MKTLYSKGSGLHDIHIEADTEDETITIIVDITKIVSILWMISFTIISSIQFQKWRKLHHNFW